MKKCNNCGAQIEDGNLFCTECGKPVPQGKSCPHCGASVSDEDTFCQNCGKKITEEPVPTSTELLHDSVQGSNNAYEINNSGESLTPHNNSKRILYFILVLIIMGAAWLGYKYFIEYNATTYNSEDAELVRLSEEKMKKDEKKDENLSPERVFALMDNIGNTSLAKQCGLEEIYKYEYSYDGDEDDPGISYDIEIYGRDVKKGSVSDKGDCVSVEIISKSNHSCYLKHECLSDCGFELSFKDKGDADSFFNMVVDNGVYKIYDYDNYLIPKRKQFKGIRECNKVDEDIAYYMSEVSYSEGWYMIRLW